MPETLSSSATDLIHNLLQVDPAKRLSVDEVLRHPWVTKNLNTPVNWESNCPKEDIDLDCAAELGQKQRKVKFGSKDAKLMGHYFLGC